MSPCHIFSRSALLLAAFAAALSLFPAGARAERKEQILHSFTGGSDGQEPVSLVSNSKGELFGATIYGGGTGCGGYGCGTIFEFSKNGTERIIYTFSGSSDGANPAGDLLIGKDGNFYGMTSAGGSDSCSGGCGVVFQVSPTGAEKTLYSFTGGADGSQPDGGLTEDGAGNLYGVTYAGGAGNGGTIFEINAKDKEKTLHSFSGDTEGYKPSAGLIFDAMGNLYGTTSIGGPEGYGTVFKLTPTGVYSVLHGFGDGDDGQDSNTLLLLDAEGNLFGTAEEGGSGHQGIVFKIAPNGKEKVLHAFVADGQDGTFPDGGLTEDADGNLYGLTYTGGSAFAGSLYQITKAGKEKILYSFKYGSDGAFPSGELLTDKKGNFLGTTILGGPDNFGTIFEVEH